MEKVKVQGMAHITGGGFVDNIPRVLPEGCRAVIDRDAWKVPLLFSFLQRQGRVDADEMYRVFNMGIGFVLIVRPADAARALGILERFRIFSPAVIGLIEKGSRGVAYKGG